MNIMNMVIEVYISNDLLNAHHPIYELELDQYCGLLMSSIPLLLSKKNSKICYIEFYIYHSFVF